MIDYGDIVLTLPLTTFKKNLNAVHCTLQPKEKVMFVMFIRPSSNGCFTALRSQ